MTFTLICHSVLFEEVLKISTFPVLIASRSSNETVTDTRSDDLISSRYSPDDLQQIEDPFLVLLIPWGRNEKHEKEFTFARKRDAHRDMPSEIHAGID